MPATLFDYMQRTQRFIRDTQQKLIDPQDIIYHINDARREVAMRSQCIRVLPLVYGSITSAEIVSGGAGYINPTVVISAPDMPSGVPPFPNGAQATATATQSGGVIEDINISYGGQGYFQPTITIQDAGEIIYLVDGFGNRIVDGFGNPIVLSVSPGGSGAVIEPVMTPMSLLQQGQEVYPFSAIDLTPFPGVASIYTVRSVSILYTNYRYSVPIYSFTIYQAKIRQYTGGSYQYVPCFGSLFGRGLAGSFYLYPPPSQTYQLEWDCSCLPQDLVANDSAEAIPDPWTDAVAYWAARNCFLELQNRNAAREMETMFDQRMSRFGYYVEPGRAINPYGRP